MNQKTTVEELLRKVREPAEKAPSMHSFYKGKIQVLPKCSIRNLHDFDIWYTPGVAEPCKLIKERPEDAFEYTNKGNLIAVASDGTRVLGLGDIGALAGLPVMEGKSLLFKHLGGVDAIPLMIDTRDPDTFIQVVKLVAPTFGGINLEDIASPKCFYILDKLREELDIPVWHDDQQGTSAITLAGILNGLKIVGKKLDQVLFSIIGTGAANLCLIRTLIKAGVPPKNIIAVDSKGILNQNRGDLSKLEMDNPLKYETALKINNDREGGIPDAVKDADVCIAASKPGPNTIKKEWLTKMNDDAILFAEANPIPEIWPWEAKEAGIKIIGTGRSDFPNQVNNSLGFPGIFRGTLDVRAKTITDEMHIAAAYAIAEVAEDKGINENYIVPTMDDWEVFPREATAVALKAIEQGVARRKLSKQEIYDIAEEKIKNARESTALLMKQGFIKNQSI